MAKYQKGLESRAAILTGTTKILNEQGIGLTVDMLAKEMKLSRGKITNYFPTKDSLLVNIMREYEQELGLLLQNFDWGKGPSFENMLRAMSIIMDVQYEYRCAIAYIATVSKHQHELHQHIESSFSNRIDGIKMRLSALVGQKMLLPSVLQAPDFKIYCFQYTNLLTTWVISQELYFGRNSYKEMKPYYLKGVMALYIPFLTPKGKQAFKKLEYNLLS